MAGKEAAPLPIGVNTMSFMWRTSAREAIETLAREGYRTFEVMAQRPHLDPMIEPEEARRLGKFLRDTGLTVETINMPSLDQNLASASPEMRDYSVKLFERLIVLAETIGARGVVVVTGRVNPLIPPPRHDSEAWFEEGFERVLLAARRTGVHLLLENIPMGVYPRADQLIAFADSVNDPLVEICYDIANGHFIGEDTAMGLLQVCSRLGIVHLSDTGHAAWRHDPVGQGSCDFAGFGAALREIGYAKTSMMEIIADPAVEHIVASHRKLAQWGWAGGRG